MDILKLCVEVGGCLTGEHGVGIEKRDLMTFQFNPEDLAQQTFERVWKHAESYDPRRASAKVWMLTITRRLCIDVFRANRTRSTDPDELLLMLPPAQESVEDTGVGRSEVARLRGALADLPPEQRRVLLLASLAGHTTAEIAEMEQLNPKSPEECMEAAFLAGEGGDAPAPATSTHNSTPHGH